jgi:hypothetical protein
MSFDAHDDSQELSNVLMLAVEQIVSEPIDEVEQARALRTIRPLSHKGRSIPYQRRWRLVAAAAASLLVGWIAWHSFSQSAWADVVEAVAGRPWLHAVGKATTGEKVEFWYSAAKQVMASKNGEQVFYSDVQADVLETYAPGGQQPPSIQRRSLGQDNRSRLAEQGAFFQALLADDFETALAGWGAKLIDQRRREITVDGRPRHEYRFVVADGINPDAQSEVTVLVDPNTKLPTNWEVATLAADGKKIHGVQCVLDFPESGPASIYALGVPKNAPLVDNVPRGDMRRVLQGLALGRARFDDYRGLALVGSLDPTPQGRGPEICYQVWRRGLKWRIELVQRKHRDAMPPDADPRTWWNQQLADARVTLQSLSTGTEHCTMKPVYAQPVGPDPDFPDFAKIARFEKVVRPIAAPSDPWREHYLQQMPEYMGHPTLLGEGNAPYAMTINPRPEHGPLGCVLVEALRATRGGGKTIGQRVWVDPARGYLVLRNETLEGAAEKPEVSQAIEVTDLAQSPSGRWYPTRLRAVGGSVSLETGRKTDYYINYYLDFDAEFPDELFEIPN